MRPLAEVGNASELRDGNPTGKYPTFNFLKGLSALDCMDSLTRHLDEFQDPNKPDIDPEDGCHVLAKVAWNALVCLHHIQNNPELYDDRYKGILKRKKSNVQKKRQISYSGYNTFHQCPKNSSSITNKVIGLVMSATLSYLVAWSVITLISY